MKQPASSRTGLCSWGMSAGIFCLLFGLQSLHAADFTVTTPGGQFAFNINSTNSPTLILLRGRSYTFAVNTSSFHPFRINAPGAPAPTFSGTNTFAVPTNAANYFYDCAIHGASLRGEITTVEPPLPPVITIVGLSVTTNIVLRSTGTNTWTVNPEFKTDVTSTNWFALTVQTNRFDNGTNETVCGRPTNNPVFIRIRAQEN